MAYNVDLFQCIKVKIITNYYFFKLYNKRYTKHYCVRPIDSPSVVLFQEIRFICQTKEKSIYYQTNSNKGLIKDFITSKFK